MLCRIADLTVEVPAAGDLVSRCQDYLLETVEEHPGADITIRTDLFRPGVWPGLPEDQVIYLESGIQFFTGILNYNGMVFHASAVDVDGKAYLFSAPCGTGKSTHARLWQSVIPDAQVINDDKPVLRYIEGQWYAYGTPWCGKDGININRRVPVAGICFLKQAGENRIRRLGNLEAVQKMIGQTANRFYRMERLDLMLSCVDSLVRSIPLFELENRPEAAAAQLSYETMCREAEEI